MANGQKRDLDFNPISQAADIDIYSNFEAISNSYWDMGSNDLLRKAYDGEKWTQRLEAAYATTPLHTNEKNVVGSEDNVFFSLDKTIYSLNGPEGVFSGTHGSYWDKDGNLYVQDWNISGRIMKLVRVQ